MCHINTAAIFQCISKIYLVETKERKREDEVDFFFPSFDSYSYPSWCIIYLTFASHNEQSRTMVDGICGDD